MLRFMITAPSSGSGKTMITCGMLAMLKNKGLDPCSFKCGPDYIDPMFHRSVLGCECHNLDLFLSSSDYVKKSFAEHSSGHGAALIEGVMGYYDGLGAKTTDASSYDLSVKLGIPAVLVIDAKGASMTIAATIRGMKEMRKDSMISGVILNRCSKMQYQGLKETLESETGVPLIGYLPVMEDAVVESRHLGLYTAGEIDDISARLEKIAGVMEESIDLEKLTEIADDGEAAEPGSESFDDAESEVFDAVGSGAFDNKSEAADPGDALRTQDGQRVKIAVANDEAFCFIYKETLEEMEKAGAEIVTFSPVSDSALPDGVSGIYLPGGYPEIYAGKLEENESMKSSIKSALESGIPAIAECGGFLYLGEELEGSDGKLYKMAGALPGSATKKDRLVRFGYADMRSRTSNLLLDEGDTIPVHEFHYWDSTVNGEACELKRPLSERTWDAVQASESLFAGFPHMYLAAEPGVIERFISAARKYADK